MKFEKLKIFNIFIICSKLTRLLFLCFLSIAGMLGLISLKFNLVKATEICCYIGILNLVVSFALLVVASRFNQIFKQEITYDIKEVERQKLD